MLIVILGIENWHKKLAFEKQFLGENIDTWYWINI